VCCPSTAVTYGSEVVLLPFADNVVDIGGPHLSPDRLTPQRYLYSVDTLLPGLLQHMLPYLWDIGRGFSTMRAETLYKDVRQCLNMASPGRLIGSVGPNTWRPSSPNLSRILSVVSNEQQELISRHRSGCFTAMCCFVFVCVCELLRMSALPIRKVAISGCYRAGHCLWPVEYSNGRLGTSHWWRDSVMLV
jgi:hypothetical protein